jgi:hypothetical protein
MWESGGFRDLRVRLTRLDQSVQNTPCSIQLIQPVCVGLVASHDEQQPQLDIRLGSSLEGLVVPWVFPMLYANHENQRKRTVKGDIEFSESPQNFTCAYRHER